MTFHCTRIAYKFVISSQILLIFLFVTFSARNSVIDAEARGDAPGRLADGADGSRTPQNLPPKSPKRFPFSYKINNETFQDDFYYFKMAASAAANVNEQDQDRGAILDAYLKDESRYIDGYFKSNPELSRINSDLYTTLTGHWSPDILEISFAPQCKGRANPAASSDNANANTNTKNENEFSLDKVYHASDHYIYIQYSVASKLYPVIYSFPLSSSSSGASESQACISVFCKMRDPISNGGQLIIDFNELSQQLFLSSTLPASPFLLGAVEFVERDLLAFSLDKSGHEKFDLWVWSVSLGKLVAGPFPDTYYSSRWACTTPAATSSVCWLYYNVVSKEWQVPLSINSAGPFYLSASSSSTDDDHTITTQHVYTEDDPSLTVELDQSYDKLFTFIKIAGLETSEYQQITLPSSNTKSTTTTLTTVIRRLFGTMYDLTHRNGHFYIKTNANGASNFEILKFPVNTTTSTLSKITTTAATSTTIIKANSPADFIERIEVFSNILVYWFRRNGKLHIQGLDLNAMDATSSKASTLPPTFFTIFAPPPPSTEQDSEDDEAPGYTLAHDLSMDFDSRVYRPYTTSCFLYTNSSFLNPPAMFVYDLEKGGGGGAKEEGATLLLLRYTHPSLISSSPSSLFSEKSMWTTPAHTTKSRKSLGISLLSLLGHNKEKRVDAYPKPESQSQFQSKGVLVIGYGAYGGFQDPLFDASLLALVEGYGVSVAICHARGDGDMGHEWYMEGKYTRKVNTFYDVQRCIEFLVEMGVAPLDRVAVKGRSAGGLVAGNFFTGSLLMANQQGGGGIVRPRVVIGHVPFIDPIYDLMDKSVPWTAYEWFEWGSPFDQGILDTMKQYSPYLQLQKVVELKNLQNRAVNLPSLYLSSGKADSRVPYWEPLKFAAQARSGLDEKTNANIVIRVGEGGHFEASGVNATAEWMSFLVYQLFQ